MGYDNAAARLKDVVDRGRQLNGNQNCFKAWDHLLNTEGDNTLLLYRLGIIQQLPYQLFIELDEHATDLLETVPHWRTPIEQAFLNQHMPGAWSTFMGGIPEHVSSMLLACSRALRTEHKRKDPTAEELQHLAATFKDLAARVQSANLPARLRIYLASSIAELLRRVRDYQYAGGEPIVRQAEAMMGHVVVDREYVDYMKTDDGKDLASALATTSTAFELVNSVLQLPESVGKFFAAIA